MKILIGGASGAIRSQLVARLVGGAHDVVGTTCSAAKTGALTALGAEPPIDDALDSGSVADVVAKADPNWPADVEDGVRALRHPEDGVTR